MNIRPIRKKDIDRHQRIEIPSPVNGEPRVAPVYLRTIKPDDMEWYEANAVSRGCDICGPYILVRIARIRYPNGCGLIVAIPKDSPVTPDKWTNYRPDGGPVSYASCKVFAPEPT